MSVADLAKIGAASPELSSAVGKIRTLFPQAVEFDRYFIAVALLGTHKDVDVQLESIKEHPFAADHMLINTRMAPNLIAKIPEFDETALDHIVVLHEYEEEEPVCRSYFGGKIAGSIATAYAAAKVKSYR